jgi:hypothetical protein
MTAAAMGVVDLECEDGQFGDGAPDRTSLSLLFVAAEAIDPEASRGGSSEGHLRP